MPRTADLGLRLGLLPSGPTGSILDVAGVGVGHATVWRDEPPPPAGRGVARTGVTVVDPGGRLFASPVPAGAAVLNGAGECTGLLSAREWGLLETPVFLTATMELGRVYDAACTLLGAEDPAVGVDGVLIPVVAECDDSFLSDSRTRQVEAHDVAAALTEARASVGGPPPGEGAVGAGTGMTCLGFKGGIGTASRLVPGGGTVGVLVLANFGERSRLTVAGVPVGRLLPADDPPSPGRPATSGGPGSAGRRGSVAERPRPAGSCIVVLATDGPLDGAACERLARRAGLGLARTGSTAHHGSGEIFFAFATGLRAPREMPPPRPPLTGPELDPYFAAAVEATEEAVLNALLAAPTVVGRNGHVSPGLPVDAVAALLDHHRAR